MATETPMDVPEEFESMSRDEQVEFVQNLWDRIAGAEHEVPIPAWHLSVLEERLDSRNPESDTAWEEVRDRLTHERDG